MGGAQIMSSQWVGWVPSGGCGGGGMGSSHFKVTNIRISGTHVQGNKPKTCGGPSPPSPGPPGPPGPPTPPGGGNCCYWGGCSGCSPSAWCKQSQANCEGACGGKWCPGDEFSGNSTVIV